MSRTNKVGFIIAFLIASQIVRLYLEGAYLWNPSKTSEDHITRTERVMPSEAEDLIQDKFMVHRFYKSEGFGIHDVNPYDLTLALHGSVDRLYHLIEIADVWTGPISMSVFAPGLDASFVDDAVDGIRLCWSSLRRSVTFHVVYPKTTPANVSNVGSFVYLSCKDIIRRIRRQQPTGNSNSAAAQYPHNVMRNVARSGVMTHYVLHVDSNLIPTSNLRERFNIFINKLKENNLENRRSSRSVFILPVFEIRQESMLMRNTNELIEAVETKMARPYLQETCPKCHKALNYDKWMDLASIKEEDELVVAYNVDYVQDWEPFFIVSRHSPIYDERVTSFGFDRLSHMCDLQAKGYKFHILKDEFLLYRGYRTKARMSEAEKRRKYDRAKFHKTFVSVLKRLGYADSKFNKCFK